ncbi:MAG TPA: FHA domain-containing protein [Polyangiaceae bacterium]|nr:FHA domain-containing protein [Polyangiaceae bacterium]
MNYLLEVQAPGTPAEQHELTLGSITAGSGEAAELRLGSAVFQAQHLQLDVLPEGVRVRLLDSVEGGIVFEGVQLREAMVPWGSEVFVNGVRLSLLATGERKRNAHPLLVAALAVALVALGWQGGGAAADASASTSVEPPAMTLPVAPCPEPAPPAALEQARKDEHAAQAKLERYPFDAGEGLRALEHLNVAKACFAAAGATADQSRTEQRLKALQRTLAEDLAAWRLRLDRALDQDRPRDTIAAVRGLDALVGPLGDTPYRAWLKEQRHRLERKQSR